MVVLEGIGPALIDKVEPDYRNTQQPSRWPYIRWWRDRHRAGHHCRTDPHIQALSTAPKP